MKRYSMRWTLSCLRVMIQQPVVTLSSEINYSIDLIYALNVQSDWAFYTTTCLIATWMLVHRKDHMPMTSQINIALISS